MQVVSDRATETARVASESVTRISDMTRINYDSETARVASESGSRVTAGTAHLDTVSVT